ncbi:MAG: hypothetical protein WD045_04685 [Pirellulaceae bacterium]
MDRYVEIEFDCLPLRSIERLDIPLDASPKFQEHCLRVKEALEKHGSLNTYFLHNARCTYRLLNHPTDGMIQFAFSGTVLTDSEDLTSQGSDLTVNTVQGNLPLAVRTDRAVVQRNRRTERHGGVRPLHRRRRSGKNQAANRQNQRGKRRERRVSGNVSLRLGAAEWWVRSSGAMPTPSNVGMFWRVDFLPATLD